MATYAERAQAIGNALLNATATAQQVDRLGAAIANNDGNSTAYAAMTQAAKAQFLVTRVREMLLAQVRSSDMTTASRNAQNQASTDFPETP